MEAEEFRAIWQGALKCQREGADIREIIGGELCGAPRRDRKDGGARPFGQRGVEEPGVGIAHHDRAAERAQSGDYLTRLRPERGDIAEADQFVHRTPR